MLVKNGHEEQAKIVFRGTGVEVVTKGSRILGSAGGDQEFVDTYV